MTCVHETPNGVRIDLRVSPRASKNAIAGVRENALVVRVTAPPVDGAANDAVVHVLSKALDVPKRDVTIVRGETGRSKIAAIAGVSASTIRARLSAILADQFRT